MRLLFLTLHGGGMLALEVLLTGWKFKEWVVLVLAFESLEQRDVGFLGELKANLSLLFEMDWFIGRVLSSHYQPNHVLVIL